MAIDPFHKGLRQRNARTNIDQCTSAFHDKVKGLLHSRPAMAAEMHHLIHLPSFRLASFRLACPCNQLPPSIFPSFFPSFLPRR
jgi:hypothetical protein